MRDRFKWITAAGCLLIALFVWLLWPDADSRRELLEAHDAADSGGASPLTSVGQTPPAVKPPPADNAAADTEPSASAPAPVAGKYHFVKWQDAMDEYARLVGIEYERLVAEGHPQAIVWANMNVGDRIFKNDEDPELKAALIDFMPLGNAHGIPPEARDQVPNLQNRIPNKIWRNPIWILVWAGKLPEGDQYTKVKLPNGEMLFLEEYQQVRVTWKMRFPPAAQTEAGRLGLEKLRKRELQLETSIQTAQNAEFEKTFLELEQVRTLIQQMQSPTIVDRTMQSGVSDECADHPEFEVIEMDLGVIDRDYD